jgi:hypothetical protein
MCTYIIYIYIWMDGCIERERERSGGVTVKVVQRMRQKPNPGEHQGEVSVGGFESGHHSDLHISTKSR